MPDSSFKTVAPHLNKLAGIFRRVLNYDDVLHTTYLRRPSLPQI